MAGSMELAVANEENRLAAIGEQQWEIEYSRFVHYPSSSLSSDHFSLPLLSSSTRKRLRGNWISTSSASSDSLATLKLLTADHHDSVVLLVNFRHKILEEHYISKLHITWPQVSCVSGYPARGSRIVLLSYKDCTGQIQKFALHFLSISETEKFVNTLKDILNGESVAGLPCSNAISSESECVISTGFQDRPTKDLSLVASETHCHNHMSPKLNHEDTQELNPQGAIHNHQNQGILSDFPPSFMSLLMNCRPAVEQAQPTEEADLKVQIVKYLEDTSFQDMLTKVEKVIHEMGDDLTLF